MTFEEEVRGRQIDLNLVRLETVVVVGVGGIGSWVAFNLGLSGVVEKLILIDPDVIETSNLNRTPFRIADVGAHKVDALKYLILERRPVDIDVFREKTNPELISKIQQLTASYQSKKIIVDCRDNIFNDMYHLTCKYYKIGYDGLSVTISGNPRDDKVWGEATGYRVIPSFICPAQLAANLVVADILTKHDETANNKSFDDCGRLNTSFTFNSNDVIKILYEKIARNI